MDAHSARVEGILQAAVRTELHMWMEVYGDDLMHESVDSAVYDWLDVHSDQIAAYLVHPVRQQHLKEPT